MVSESFDISNSDLASTRNRRKKTYQVKKKLFWPILAILLGIFIVLLVLTIYFGVKQKQSNDVLTSTTNEQTSNNSTPLTITTTTLAPPVERIPSKLKQENYHVTISPNLTSETFTGKISLRCANETNAHSPQAFCSTRLRVSKRRTKSFFI